MLRKKDYPATIKYKRRLYELHLSPILVEGDKVDSDARGFCQNTGDVRRVVLLKTLGKKELFQTLLHEMLHVLEYEAKINIPHDLVHDLEGPLAQILLDNFTISFKRR